MHAVVVTVTLKDYGAATKFLHEEVVPNVKQAPGFVGGYWVSIDERAGRAIIACESEEAARNVAAFVQGSPDGTVTLEKVEVGKVEEHV